MKTCDRCGVDSDPENILVFNINTKTRGKESFTLCERCCAQILHRLYEDDAIDKIKFLLSLFN